MVEIIETVATIGGLVSAYYSLKWIILILCHFIHRSVKIEEFNHGWAVVTGGTDGIGRAFAESLAAKNFKVVIISRSLEKLQKVVEIIKHSTGN